MMFDTPRTSISRRGCLPGTMLAAPRVATGLQIIREMKHYWLRSTRIAGRDHKVTQAPGYRCAIRIQDERKFPKLTEGLCANRVFCI